jgi:hypothetical protein
MNMPIDDNRQVHFTTTLFALIRESLGIKMRAAAEEMDEADNELRDVLCKVWPNHAKKNIKIHEGGTRSLLDLVVPPKHGRIPTFNLNFIHKIFFRTTRYTWISKINCWESLCHLFIYR